MLNITKDEAYSLADFIDTNLINDIRDDPDCDCLKWLRNVIHGYEKLCQYSGYVGLTEDTVPDVSPICCAECKHNVTPADEDFAECELLKAIRRPDFWCKDGERRETGESNA